MRGAGRGVQVRDAGRRVQTRGLRSRVQARGVGKRVYTRGAGRSVQPRGAGRRVEMIFEETATACMPRSLQISQLECENPTVKNNNDDGVTTFSGLHQDRCRPRHRRHRCRCRRRFRRVYTPSSISFELQRLKIYWKVTSMILRRFQSLIVIDWWFPTRIALI